MNGIPDHDLTVSARPWLAVAGVGVMLEVEVNYALDDFAPLEAALGRWGVTLGSPRRDADHYFNAPDRDFARTDEAFRVRIVGQTNYVTYKGPKLDRETKTRLEIEVAL